MALIVEDGTGLSTAESYVSVTEATTFHAARGVADALWADLDTDVKEAALRKACDYMVQTYRGRWKGFMKSQTQALDWPRYYVFPDPAFVYALASDSVPVLVKNACCALALKATTTVLLDDITATGAVIHEQVGPLSVNYEPNGQRTARYPAIDRGLSSLLQDSGSIFQATAALG